MDKSQLHNPISHLDSLYCEEEHFEIDLGGWSGFEGESENVNCDESVKKKSPLVLSEHDLFWEDDELVSLIAKEKKTHLGLDQIDLNPDRSIERREVVDWILKVNAHYGFTALTTFLAVNYFDRFVISHGFQREKKPWMTQLAAVACLSLAAKVEETQVPLLLDLQVEDSKYVFEAKTIQRMELLVLSSLQWKMHPVTPISFFDHIIRRLGLKNHFHFEFLSRCERLILSAVTDSRYLSYLPSVLATAIMLHAIKEVEFETPNALDYENQLLDVLKMSKDKVDDCYKLIGELLPNCGYNRYETRKRKYGSIPGSPNGVVDAYLSCDSSNDSWAVGLSNSSSHEALFKKRRAEDQQTILGPFNLASMGVLGSLW